MFNQFGKVTHYSVYKEHIKYKIIINLTYTYVFICFEVMHQQIMY